MLPPTRTPAPRYCGSATRRGIIVRPKSYVHCVRVQCWVPACEGVDFVDCVDFVDAVDGADRGCGDGGRRQLAAGRGRLETAAGQSSPGTLGTAASSRCV